jgi:hypothetical protein
MTFKIRITYMNISDAGLPLFALGVADSMNGNANFANPPHTPAALRAKIAEYQDALSLAKLGDERAIFLKNTRRKELQLMLHEQAGYVLGASKNDPDILAGSGFNISKARSKGTLDTLSIVTGEKPGQVTSTMKGVRNARMYFHLYTPDPVSVDSVWTEAMVTDKSHVHTGLTPGLRYWFRVKAILQDGREVFTDLVWKMVQ